jgi:hypothetical protein
MSEAASLCQEATENNYCSETASCYHSVVKIKKSILSTYLSELGRRGGKARMKTMTAEQRRKSAHKAARASAKVRQQKARVKKEATRPRAAS